MALLGRITACFGMGSSTATTDDAPGAQSSSQQARPSTAQPQSQLTTLPTMQPHRPGRRYPAGHDAAVLIPQHPGSRAQVAATTAAGAANATRMPSFSSVASFASTASTAGSTESALQARRASVDSRADRAGEDTSPELLGLLTRHGLINPPKLSPGQAQAVTQALQVLNGDHATFEATRDNVRMAIELGKPEKYAAAITLLRCKLIDTNHVMPDIRIDATRQELADLLAAGHRCRSKPDGSVHLISDRNTFLHALALMADDAEVGAGRDYGFKPVPLQQRIDDLVACGAKLNARNAEGQNALEAALYVNPNCKAIAARLIAHGADPVATDIQARTMLHRAIYSGRANVVATLLESLPDQAARKRYVNAMSWPGGRTAVDLACVEVTDRAARAAILKTLVENGAKQTPCNLALLRAIVDDDHELVADLLAAGVRKATATVPGTEHPLFQPLCSAARMASDPRVIEALIAGGAPLENITLTPDEISIGIGPTAISEAAQFNRNPAIVAALLAAGASPNLNYGFSDDTCMHLAAGSNPEPAVLKVLLDNGGQANARGESGRTPLHAAAAEPANRAAEKIAILLAAGADPTLTDRDGFTPRQIAEHYGVTWPAP